MKQSADGEHSIRLNFGCLRGACCACGASLFRLSFTPIVHFGVQEEGKSNDLYEAQYEQQNDDDGGVHLHGVVHDDVLRRSVAVGDSDLLGPCSQ